MPGRQTEYLSREKGKNIPRVSVESFPPSYDLRTKNKLTSVKNQANCGSCWAFATYASLESFLLPSENWDFSEQNLIDKHEFDYGPCVGGHIYMSTAYLSRWSGPIKEEDDPYIYSSSGLTVRKHVQDVIFILPRPGYLANDIIKETIMNHGAIYASMYYVSSFYNLVNRAYYNSGTKEGGHAVAIVGWDDNFDRNKFNTPPPGNGAFIVKNSWGTTWGESGYFYVSYYDEFLAKRDLSAAVKAETPTNYQVVYQYDPLGWISSLGYGVETAWFANIFTANSTFPLTAVGFYASSALSSYEIFIYTDVTDEQPRSGALVSVKSGNLTSPGYFTIPLDRSVSLKVNQKFSVVVRLSTGNYNYPIPFERPLSNYSSRATANAGESFISYDGVAWSDLHTSWDGRYRNSNVCLKAYAGYPPLYPPSGVALQRLENNFVFFKEYINRLTWQANPQNKTNVIAYRIYRKNRGAADKTFQLIAEVTNSVFMYDDRGLKKTDFYSYWLTAVDDYGRESEPATVSN
ncbi:MAG: lectin like domain-containing protein [Clostridiales bacterium]|nr:lectin like domain-containing protein [Clostridiales bacterium]